MDFPWNNKNPFLVLIVVPCCIQLLISLWLFFVLLMSKEVSRAAQEKFSLMEFFLLAHKLHDEVNERLIEVENVG